MIKKTTEGQAQVKIVLEIFMPTHLVLFFFFALS